MLQKLQKIQYAPNHEKGTRISTKPKFGIGTHHELVQKTENFGPHNKTYN